MGTKLYIGNLAFSSTEDSIKNLFSQHGSVVSCQLITDRETGRSKGFGFVEMASTEEAQNVISTLDGREVDGRQIKVNEARPKENRETRSNNGFRNSFSRSY
ncbi:RNA-binding protein [bacterium]|nr:RNA-binding protein [bacterium]